MKTEAKKHTPTPWEVDSRGILQSVSKHIETIDPLSSGTGVKMVQEGLGRISMVLNPSNAAFIVQAVNAHDALTKENLMLKAQKDELVEALQKAMNQLAGIAGGGGHLAAKLSDPRTTPAWATMEAALKLAGVKS